MFSRSFQTSSHTPLRRRKRVLLACTSCRNRKSRVSLYSSKSLLMQLKYIKCNGKRPSCSPYLDLGVHCVYEEVSRGSCSPRGIEHKDDYPHANVNNRRMNNHEDYEKYQLRQRIKELEAKIRSNPGVSLAGPSKDKGIALQKTSPLVLNAETSQGTCELPSTNVAQVINEVHVDTLATVTFDDVPEVVFRDIGCFGKSQS